MKQTGCPQGQKGWDITVLGVGAGQDGAWGKASGFLFNIYFSPSLIHAHPRLSWKNTDAFECGSVAMWFRGRHEHRPWKIEANTGKQGRQTWRAICPDWSTKAGDCVNVSSVMSEKGSLVPFQGVPFKKDYSKSTLVFKMLDLAKHLSWFKDNNILFVNLENFNPFWAILLLINII